MKNSNKSETQVTIRNAEIRDASSIASLCEQLGYPTQVDLVNERIQAVLQLDDHAFLVAERNRDEIIGWVHVYRYALVIVDVWAELGGLIVDEQFRGKGFGRLLMDHAEHWAREHNCRILRVRTNVNRSEAPTFYTAIGYRFWKTQHSFVKSLPTHAEDPSLESMAP